jgi:recombination protein RecA
MYGNPETTTGGRALKFFSSVRIDVRKIDSIKKGTDIIGNRVRAKVVKNKVAPPFRQAEFDLIFGEGASKEGGILDMAVEEGIVKRSGAWYTYGEQRLGQGREAAKELMKETPALRSEIEQKTRSALGLNKDEAANTAASGTKSHSVAASPAVENA